MELDIIVPVRRRAGVDRLLRSLARNTVLPDLVLLVSNELEARDVDPHGLDVRIVGFRSDSYPIGFNDAALRRNVGIWASRASHVLTFDDDQVASPSLVQAARRVLASAPVCWGHHRFIDMDAVSFEQLLTLPPEAGRARENPPEAWHHWHSAYAGLFAAERALLQQVGGFDMIFSGRHGGEDQDLGRRLAAALGHSAIYVHEPPFAWHPERQLPWDAPRYTNICAGEHELVAGEVEGVPAQRCVRCPFYWVTDESFTWDAVRMPFDEARVQLTRQRVPRLSSARAVASILEGMDAGNLRSIADALGPAYERYVQEVSAPDMAVSLQGATLLWALCDELSPRTVLDLGSGFSSFVLRSHAARNGASVVSVDDDPTWLERSRQFMLGHELPAEEFRLWSELPREPAFDLIFYDLGSMATRIRLLPDVLALLPPNGVLVLDDMHKEEYAPVLERALSGGVWRFCDARDWSLDHYGRFMALVTRTG